MASATPLGTLGLNRNPRLRSAKGANHARARPACPQRMPHKAAWQRKAASPKPSCFRAAKRLSSRASAQSYRSISAARPACPNSLTRPATLPSSYLDANPAKPCQKPSTAAMSPANPQGSSPGLLSRHISANACSCSCPAPTGNPRILLASTLSPIISGTSTSANSAGCASNRRARSRSDKKPSISPARCASPRRSKSSTHLPPSFSSSSTHMRTHEYPIPGTRGGQQNTPRMESMPSMGKLNASSSSSRDSQSAPTAATSDSLPRPNTIIARRARSAPCARGSTRAWLITCSHVCRRPASQRASLVRMRAQAPTSAGTPFVSSLTSTSRAMDSQRAHMLISCSDTPSMSGPRKCAWGRTRGSSPLLGTQAITTCAPRLAQKCNARAKSATWSRSRRGRLSINSSGLVSSRSYASF